MIVEMLVIFGRPWQKLDGELSEPCVDNPMRSCIELHCMQYICNMQALLCPPYACEQTRWEARTHCSHASQLPTSTPHIRRVSLPSLQREAMTTVDRHPSRACRQASRGVRELSGTLSGLGEKISCQGLRAGRGLPGATMERSTQKKASSGLG